MTRLLLVLMTFDNKKTITQDLAEIEPSIFWFLIDGGIHEDVVYRFHVDRKQSSRLETRASHSGSSKINFKILH